ncbi:MAG: hypothetical protein JWM57_386, partial [Phycisphaerales bacterium]|nr:hypothetical protein [Phycisphaerales bacterium]
MSVRETIAQKPAVVGVVAGVMLLAAASWAIFVLKPASTSALTKAYYSDDDGKTTFVDGIDRVPPFDHNGKTAVRAVLFTADDHGTSFVGYLERYTPQAARKLRESQEAAAAGRAPMVTAGS